MKFRAVGGGTPLPPKVLEEERHLVEHQEFKPRLEGLELAQYRNRVESVLRTLFTTLDRLLVRQYQTYMA
jgi:hypothetical protein